MSQIIRAQKKLNVLRSLIKQNNELVMLDNLSCKCQRTQSETNTKSKKGQIFKAVILETRAPIHRNDGSSLKFQRNTAVLLSAQLSPLGTRIQSFVPYELRHQNLSKILALSSSSI